MVNPYPPHCLGHIEWEINRLAERLGQYVTDNPQRQRVTGEDFEPGNDPLESLAEKVLLRTAITSLRVAQDLVTWVIGDPN